MMMQVVKVPIVFSSTTDFSGKFSYVNFYTSLEKTAITDMNNNKMLQYVSCYDINPAGF